MDSPNTHFKLAFRLSLFALIAVLFYLSLHSYKTAQQQGLFVENSAPEKNTSAAQRISQLSTQLEYMVWKNERRQVGVELTQLLRSELNQRPFDGPLWRQLVYAETEAGFSARNRIWTLERASMLLRWREKEQFLLSHHCFKSYDEFNLQSSDFCADLLRGLPDSSNVKTLAAEVGVNVRQVRKILEEQGIAIPKVK